MVKSPNGPLKEQTRKILFGCCQKVSIPIAVRTQRQDCVTNTDCFKISRLSSERLETSKQACKGRRMILNTSLFHGPAVVSTCDGEHIKTSLISHFLSQEACIKGHALKTRRLFLALIVDSEAPSHIGFLLTHTPPKQPLSERPIQNCCCTRECYWQCLDCVWGLIA